MSLLLSLWLCLLHCCATACCKYHTSHLAKWSRRMSSEPFASATFYTCRPDLICREKMPWRELLGEDIGSAYWWTWSCTRDLHVFMAVTCAPILVGVANRESWNRQNITHDFVFLYDNIIPSNICDTFEWKALMQWVTPYEVRNDTHPYICNLWHAIPQAMNICMWDASV